MLIFAILQICIIVHYHGTGSLFHKTYGHRYVDAAGFFCSFVSLCLFGSIIGTMFKYQVRSGVLSMLVLLFTAIYAIGFTILFKVDYDH
jgi:hypothetical protein